jgi:hypothetical protein
MCVCTLLVGFIEGVLQNKIVVRLVKALFSLVVCVITEMRFPIQ